MMLHIGSPGCIELCITVSASREKGFFCGLIHFKLNFVKKIVPSFPKPTGLAALKNTTRFLTHYREKASYSKYMKRRIMCILSAALSPSSSLKPTFLHERYHFGTEAR